MSKTNFAIINKYSKQSIFQGSYPECQEHFNKQDKQFRRTHMIKLINTYKPIKQNES